MLGPRIPKRNSPSLTFCLLVSPIPIPAKTSLFPLSQPQPPSLSSYRETRDWCLLHTIPVAKYMPCPHATYHRTHPCLPAIGQVLVLSLPPTLLYQLHFFCYRHVHISSFSQASKAHKPSFLYTLSLASKSSFDLHSQASGLCSLTSNLHLSPLQPGFPSSELTTVKV